MEGQSPAAIRRRRVVRSWAIVVDRTAGSGAPCLAAMQGRTVEAMRRGVMTVEVADGDEARGEPSTQERIELV